MQSRLPSRLFVVTMGVVAAGVLASLHAGCSGDSTTPTGGSATTGAGASTSSASGSGGATTGGGSATGGASATSGTGGSGAQGGSGGQGGSGAQGGGGSGGGWPTCDAPEPGAVQKTIHQIWQDNPQQPTEVWVPGVYVTAVSKGGCEAGTACQIFVQQGLSYPDLAAGSQQAIKIFISANTASHFVGIQAGQQVDVDAFAWRYDVMGQNELLLQVNLQLKGCAKAVGQGVAAPVTVQLSQLTLDAYENTVGPLLVKVDLVSGKPQLPAETFGLWTTGVFSDAGPEAIVSLSPFFLAGGVFTGFAAANQNKVHDFDSVTGVFGLFIPPADPTSKYKELYPRAQAEYPIKLVH